MADDQQERKSKYRLGESLKKDKLGKRLIIAVIIWISLALFLHFREVRVEVLQLDATAKNYIVAQVDFEFPDEEGTVILRQQSLQDIGPIYRIKEKEIVKRRYQFDEFIIHNNRWRSDLPKTTFEEMYNAADFVKSLLLFVRFTDERTLKRMESMKLSTDNYYVFDPTSHDSARLPNSFWNSVRAQLSKKYGYPSELENYTINYFNQYNWKLTQDPDEQRILRKIIESSIPDKYTKVQAGSRIIDQGENVSSRHIAMLHAMKSALGEKRRLWSPLTILGSLLFSAVVTLLGLYYLKIDHKKFLKSVPRLALFATILLLTLILSKLTEYFLIQNAGNFTEDIRYPLFIPFAALLICVLIGEEIAIFTACILAILESLTLAVDHSRFLVINIVAAIAAIICSRSLRKRKEVFVVCGKVWLVTIPIYFIYAFGHDSFWDVHILSDFLSTFAFLLLTAILVVGLLPIFESIFHIMTDITLMEYMDPNNELLRRLSLEAPGTYQHSLVVGSLAESAAQAIGAGGLFCRVASMYHDIGKLFNPHYFTENQMGGFNIHQLLTPLESTQVIIAHVTEGESLAKKHGLPGTFLDIIREHHGTTLVYYFYCKQVEQMGGDVDAVDEKQFRYPGPKPRSKESAIIMIADTIEAASRSMDEVNEEAIGELVDRLIADKAEEGQFDECQLTFEELGRVKQAIIKTLSVTRHLRIKYPERNK